MNTNNNEGDLELDMKHLLDHARALFIFHATQRLNSVRYYFAVYVVFFGGYIAVLRDTGIDEGMRQYVLCAIAFSGAAVSWAYYQLDKRNAELVQVDENAMHFLEFHLTKQVPEGLIDEAGEFPDKEIATLYKEHNVNPVMIARIMDKAPDTRAGKFIYGNTYGKILRLSFRTIFFLSLAAGIVPLFVALVALSPTP